MKIIKNNKEVSYFELILLLAFLTSLGALTIDIQLPAMPLILQSFGLTESNQQQFIITAYMVGFAGAQIFYGPISDAIGRKPVLLFGLTLYVIASVFCLFADSYWLFLLARAGQGVGAASARIMVNAITRDVFEGNEMAKVMSLIMLIFILVPVFAPTLGGLIMYFYDWSFILYVFVGYGVLVFFWVMFRMPETLNFDNKKSLNLSKVLVSFKEVASEPISMAFAAVSGIVFSGFMAYLNSSEQIFSQFYNAKEAYPMIFGVIALFFGLAAFINSKIVMKYGALKVTYIAMILMILLNAVSLLLVMFFDGLPPLWLFALSLGAINICIGLVFGNVMSIAMLPLGRSAGMGASVIGTISTILATIIGIFISQNLEQNVYPVVIGFLATSLLSFMLVHIYRKDVMELFIKSEA